MSDDVKSLLAFIFLCVLFTGVLGFVIHNAVERYRADNLCEARCGDHRHRLLIENDDEFVCYCAQGSDLHRIQTSP